MFGSQPNKDNEAVMIFVDYPTDQINKVTLWVNCPGCHGNDVIIHPGQQRRCKICGQAVVCADSE